MRNEIYNQYQSRIRVFSCNKSEEEEAKKNLHCNSSFPEAEFKQISISVHEKAQNK